MALSDKILENKLLSLFILMKKKPMSDEEYARKLAEIIDEQIKTADVLPGITVSVDPVTHNGASTGKGSLL